MKIYVDFFTEYWHKDNVDKTNEMMTDELERAGVVGTNEGITRIWTGLTAEEHNSLGEYVLTLDFPPKNSEMNEFFRRVMTGDLEFLCRYPQNGPNAKNQTYRYTHSIPNSVCTLLSSSCQFVKLIEHILYSLQNFITSFDYIDYTIIHPIVN